MTQLLGFLGMPAAPRIANFIQNPAQLSIGNNLGTYGQSNIAQTYGGIFDLALAPGQFCLIPEGQWLSQAGAYSDLQYFDQQTLMWRNLAMYADVAPIPISSDGTNWRFVNTSGCPVGAVITNAGSTGPTTATVYTTLGSWNGGVFVAGTPTVTTVASAGGSTWNTFFGGALSTTTTGWIVTAGTLYTVAPKLIVIPPVAQGAQPFVPATLVCTISGGVINLVTVTNQGAGYVSAPTVLIVNQQGDTTGSSGVITIPAASVTGSGAITAILQNTLGTVLTVAPTLTITGAGAGAATVIMNFSMTAAAAGTVTAGSVYTNGYGLYANGGIVTATPIYTNPATEKGIITPTQPNIFSAQTTVQNMNSANTIFAFNGSGFQVAPLALTGLGLNTTVGYVTAVPVGGVNDICYLYPI